MQHLSAVEVVELLGMQPHPEGGFYRETFRDEAPVGPDAARAASTAIYYLLPAGQVSAWHRVDAAEVWHWYGGAPLELSVSIDGVAVERVVLGNRLAEGDRPQGVVEKGAWQAARSLGAWTLVGCTVAPGFEFAGFEMAPRGWEPGAGAI